MPTEKEKEVYVEVENKGCYARPLLVSTTVLTQEHVPVSGPNQHGRVLYKYARAQGWVLMHPLKHFDYSGDGNGMSHLRSEVKPFIGAGGQKEAEEKATWWHRSIHPGCFHSEPVAPIK